jgi:hypothetical protein
MPPAPRTPLRNDDETITCPVCGATTRRTGRRRYCSDACRQTAWRRRTTPLADPDPVPSGHSRKERTVYQCTDCDARYLGEQWCPDCVRPCRRLGPGGHCECGELLTTEELIHNN